MAALFVGLICAFLLAPRPGLAASIVVQQRVKTSQAWYRYRAPLLSDDEVFRSKTTGLSQATVFLDSNGGNLLAGIRIGTLIRQRGFSTVVELRIALATSLARLARNSNALGLGRRVATRGRVRTDAVSCLFQCRHLHVRSLIVSHETTPSFYPLDLTLAIKNRGCPPTPSRWEIYLAGKSKPVPLSDFSAIMSEVTRAGRAALAELLVKCDDFSRRQISACGMVRSFARSTLGEASSKSVVSVLASVSPHNTALDRTSATGLSPNCSRSKIRRKLIACETCSAIDCDERPPPLPPRPRSASLKSPKSWRPAYRTFPSPWGNGHAECLRSVFQLVPCYRRGVAISRPSQTEAQMHFLPARQVCGDHPISLEMLPLSSIKGNPNNAREHNRKQLANLARSIEKFGFITPIVVDETGELLCGHARVLAARQLKIQAIPAVRASHLSKFAETRFRPGRQSAGRARLLERKIAEARAAVPERTGHRLRFSRTRLRHRGNRLYPRRMMMRPTIAPTHFPETLATSRRFPGLEIFGSSNNTASTAARRWRPSSYQRLLAA